MHIFLSRFAILRVIFLVPAIGLCADSQRVLTWNDLAHLERIGNLAVSPNGQWLACVLQRPGISATLQMQRDMAGNDRGDIWLVPASGGKPRILTNGAETGTGYWAPVWSRHQTNRDVCYSQGGCVVVGLGYGVGTAAKGNGAKHCQYLIDWAKTQLCGGKQS
jgi:hypothetical protein